MNLEHLDIIKSAFPNDYKEKCKRLERKNKGGQSNEFGNSYELHFAVYRIIVNLYQEIQKVNNYTKFSTQTYTFIDDLLEENNFQLNYYQLKSGKNVTWDQDICSDFQDQNTLLKSMAQKDKVFSLNLVVQNFDIANSLKTNVPIEFDVSFNVICFKKTASLRNQIEINEDFKQVIKQICYSGDIDKLETLAESILGIWAGSDKNNISSEWVLEKLKNRNSNYLLGDINIQFDEELTIILNKIIGFEYFNEKGYFTWRFNNSDFGQFPEPINSQSYLIWQKILISNSSKIITFEDIEQFLV